MSGMSDTLFKSLSAKDICAIIRTCYESKVVSLEIDNFVVKFGFEKEVKEEIKPQVLQFPEAESQVYGEYEDIEENREILEELRLAQLMTEDPAAYEQMIIDENTESEGLRNGTTDN